MVLLGGRRREQEQDHEAKRKSFVLGDQEERLPRCESAALPCDLQNLRWSESADGGSRTRTVVVLVFSFLLSPGADSGHGAAGRDLARTGPSLGQAQAGQSQPARARSGPAEPGRQHGRVGAVVLDSPRNKWRIVFVVYGN